MTKPLLSAASSPVVVTAMPGERGEDAPAVLASPQPRVGLLRLLWRHRASRAGLVMLALIAAAALLAPWIAPHDPAVQNLQRTFDAPSAAHWLGTDSLGRDLLSRLLHGARITLAMVGSICLASGLVGLVVGTVAALAGRWVDGLLMRTTDIFLALPGLVLALAIAAALGPGLVNAAIAITLTAWPPIARLARSEALVVARADYIDAVRIQGASALRIVALHVSPMVAGTVAVRVALSASSVALRAAGLAFLGLGAQPPSPEWGAMLAPSQAYLLQHPAVALVPGGAIVLLALAINLVADGLRDSLDTRHE
jgi:peptide/nickel transport system permease protein